jgi:hypothetical protein
MTRRWRSNICALSSRAASTPPPFMPPEAPRAMDLARLSLVMTRLGLAAILLVPLALPFARRVGPPMLVAGALVLALGLAIGRAQAAGARWRGVSAFEACCALVFAVAFASLAWTPLPLRGLAQAGACALVFASGLLALRLAPAPEAWAHRLLAGALALGAAVAALDLWLGGPLAASMRGAPEAHRYNMVAASLLAIACGLAPRADVSSLWRGGAFAATGALALVSDSESAKLALVAALFAYGLARLAPQRALAGLVAASFLVCFLGAFWFGDAAAPLVARGGAFLEAGHAGERLEIWRGSAAFALQGLPWGHGAGASLAFAEGAPGAAAPAGMGWGHAHNNFIQLWLELGVPGGLAALAACLALARALAGMERALFAQACALLAAGALVALVSHGLWQAWWWSALFIAAFALRVTGTKPLTFREP